jgi:hypothetical protein
VRVNADQWGLLGGRADAWNVRSIARDGAGQLVERIEQ